MNCPDEHVLTRLAAETPGFPWDLPPEGPPSVRPREGVRKWLSPRCLSSLGLRTEDAAFGVSRALPHRSEWVLFHRLSPACGEYTCAFATVAQTFASTGEGEQRLGCQRTKRLESPL
jgi:hypothetical protein